MATPLTLVAIERGIRFLQSEIAKIEAEGPATQPEWERNRQRALRELRSALRRDERARERWTRTQT